MFILKNPKNINFYFFSRSELPDYLKKELDRKYFYSCVCIVGNKVKIIKNKIFLVNELSQQLSKGVLEEVTGVKFNEGIFYDIYLDLLKNYIEDD